MSKQILSIFLLFTCLICMTAVTACSAEKDLIVDEDFINRSHGGTSSDKTTTLIISGVFAIIVAVVLYAKREHNIQKSKLADLLKSKQNKNKSEDDKGNSDHAV